MNLHDRLSQSPEGRRSLASARLRYSVMKSLTRALNDSGLSQSELAKRLGLRRSAVNAVIKGTGNVRVNTVAEYLDAMGFEASLVVSPTGVARARTQAWRAIALPRVPANSALETRKGDDMAWSSLGRATKVDDMRPGRRSEFARTA